MRARIAAIRADRQRGAGELAQEALRTLRLAAEQGGNDEALQRTLREAAQALMTARPSMAAVTNAARWFLREWGDGTAARAVAACDALLERTATASHGAGVRAAGLLRDGATVLTCSYSTAVTRALRLAWGRGCRLSVLALESWHGDVAYGARLKEALAGDPIAVRLVPDAQVTEAVGWAELALVGADQVLPDGSLVNGTPTLALARAARRRIPLYSIAESFKFAEVALQEPLEPGFDLVPAELVTGYVTEKGILPPTAVAQTQRGLREG
ncbi:MAG: hypothetical protein HY683_05865 [Chloroflexi bacterium]|nr:hypothetical protein [Chloroflexota bacterium]